MANAYNYSNIATPTTLSGNINNSVTTATVASTTGWPSSFPYIVAFDFATANEELVKVTANAAGTLTIQRGFGGTSAVSHSTGAATRHVWNAQDGTDFRTHEAATAAAHGLSGSFVGTTDIQTLTNKTLTAPSITNGAYSSGGSLAGTFTGTPTFSGALTLSGTPVISAGASMSGTFTGAHTYSGTVTLSGTPSLIASGEIQHSNLYRGTRATSTDSQLEARVTGDANARWFVRTDGAMRWGPGTTTFDTELRRDGVDILGTPDTFQIQPASTALDGLAVNLPTSTTGDLLNLRVNAAIQAAMDSSGSFRIYQGNAASTYTVTVTGGGSATFTTTDGFYWRLGKLVFFRAYWVVGTAGTGSTVLTVTMPSTPLRGGFRQNIPGGLRDGGSVTGPVAGLVFAGGSGAVLDRIVMRDGNDAVGTSLTSGSIWTLEGWYQEA